MRWDKFAVCVASILYSPNHASVTFPLSNAQETPEKKKLCDEI